MKTTVNIQIDSELRKKFKLKSISEDKSMGKYLEELIINELNRKNGNKKE